ncbi:hypothetical protein [Natronorubrum sulfidifaciens]|nr:hypothetical protein [Natronorubrum sulfidifaciens]
MTTTRSVALLVLVATIGLTVAPIASGAVVGALTDETTADTDTTESESTTSVSMFMQSSAADTENTVEDGMFEAKYDAADNESRTDLVHDRTTTLEQRLEALEAERDQLREREDDLSRGEYQARMTRLTVEIDSLERSAGHVEKRANGADVEDRLATLRENASELRGPDVAEIARGLGGGNGAPGGGPADDAGPPTESPGTGPNADTGAEAGPQTNTSGTGPNAGVGAEKASPTTDPDPEPNATATVEPASESDSRADLDADDDPDADDEPDSNEP